MTLLIAIVAFPLLLFVSGYVTYRAWVAHDLNLPTAEALYVCVLLSILVASVVGLALAEVGVFSLAALLVIVAVYSLAVFVLRRDQFAVAAWPRVQLSMYMVALIALVALAAMLFARPFPYVRGVADAGIYVNTGVSLARTGGLVLHDSLLAELPAEATRQFILGRPNERFSYEHMRLPGFYVLDQNQGTVVAQFLHLYPVWIAIFVSILGLEWGLYVTPFFGLLGALGVYFAARALFNRGVGLVAMLLLVINGAQIWFSRYPVAEALTQALAWGGIYTFTCFIELQPDRLARWFGLVAGLSLGMIFLVRADLILFFVPIAAYLGVLRLTRIWRVEHVFFFVSFAAVVAYALLHTALFARFYVVDSYSHVLRMKNFDTMLPQFALAGLIVLTVLVLIDRNTARLAAFLHRLKVWRNIFALAAIILIVLFVAYAYCVSPGLLTSPSGLWSYIGGVTPTGQKFNLVHLGWYVSPLGIILAVAGLALIIWRKSFRKTWFFLSITLFYTVFYLEELYSNPHYIYTMRHYVPLVIPALAIFITYALAWLWSWPRFKFAARSVAIGLLVLLAAYYAYTDRFIIPHTEFAGGLEQIEALANRYDDHTIFLFSNNRDEPALIATPLEYIFGHDAVVAVFNQPNGEVIAAQIQRWQVERRRVVVLMGTNGGKLWLPGFALVSVGEFAFQVPELEFAYDYMPRNVYTVSLPMGIYELQPESSVKVTYPLEIDVGGFDYHFLVDDFFDKETDAQGTTFRWTGKTPEEFERTGGGAAACLRIPWSASAVEKGATISMRLSGWRPEGIEPAVVTVSLGDTVLNKFTLSRHFETYTVTVPPGTLAGAETVLLQLESNGWIPAKVGAGSDKRILGVQVDWVKVEVEAGR